MNLPYVLSIFYHPPADHSILCVARTMAMLRRVALLFAAVVLLLRFDSVLGTFEGTLECEELTALECAFAVSSAGARCVLEKCTLSNGDVIPICQTSTILAERPAEWIESDECISACGLERQTYGLSTDSLMDSSTVDKLCSPECQSNCPNIIDIYFKLAVGEGVYLPRLCNENKFNARRVLITRNGPQADQGGGPFWSSTHKHSLASAETPVPQPSPASPVYTAPLFPGPFPGLYLPAPPAPYNVPKKGKKPLFISPAPSPSPSPAPVPVSAPYPAASLLPELISQASSVGFSNDFEDGDY